jgi:hypothetical protein
LVSAGAWRGSFAMAFSKRSLAWCGFFEFQRRVA